MDVKESQCNACGDLCGEAVDCRIWVYQGQEYQAPPKAMVIEAMLNEIYGESKKGSEYVAQTGDVPNNLKRFFAARYQQVAM